MILKGFKEKSNKKYINKTLSRRVVVPSNERVKRVGIIVNNNESVNYNWFKALKERLNTAEIVIVAFTKDKEKDESNELIPVYDEKDIGWNGTIKNKNLKTFITIEFDLLISYYSEDNTLLKLLTAASKAKFKVGILQDDERLNDLIIKTEFEGFKMFSSELMKYLKILNKI